MHEWALAEGVITTALKEAEKGGLCRVTRIVVAIGELQQIETDIFRDALRAVMPPSEPRLAAVEIELESEPARFACRVCNREYTIPEACAELDEEKSEAIHFIPELAHAYLACPGCGSVDFEVLSGRGVWINRLEGEDEGGS